MEKQMKTTQRRIRFGLLTSFLALAMTPGAAVAAAQTASLHTNAAPPAGQYAPPPAGAETSGSTYDDHAQRYDRNYADQYSRWAAQNCVDKRDNNTAAGAIIGGVLGAALGASATGHGAHAAGAIAGGAIGAAAGAAIGNADTACPPGYVVRTGAPAFYYDGPIYYGPDVIYGPPWYEPWVWVGGHWVYRPYRYWYWYHPVYWRPGWRPGHWHYRYHRW
jgi:hypothetical protein